MWLWSQRAKAPRGCTNTEARPIAGGHAHEYDLMLLGRIHGEQRWQNQPASAWSVDDFDVAEIRPTFTEAIQRGRLEEPGTPEPADLLRGLGLFKEGVVLRAAETLLDNSEGIEAYPPRCLRAPGEHGEVSA